ncbi:APC family permease [Bradyrhizobium sp. CCBAU 65884]|uniref:APC family permease n=1 Tax=Bradyrhizobium sp. CCBAU 65884 TaxID=722477 RepID=UPI0023063DF3|nr:amino acid permease [Bradyrhizobium sp. CCBAU 65884]
MEKVPELERTIGRAQGTILAVSAVVGISVLALPAVTAQEAGPAALVSWALVAMLSFPLVWTLSEFAIRNPTAGGVIDYVSSAFGTRCGTALGWTFLGAVPIGIPIVAVIATQYAAHLGGWSGQSAQWLAVGATTFSVLLNGLGLAAASRLQMAIVGVVVALMVSTVIAAWPLLHHDSLTPFAPRGWEAVGEAMVPIFFSFVGWEMVAPLVEEFKNPRRDVRVSMFVAAVVVSIIYGAFAYVTIGTGAYQQSDGVMAFPLLIERTIGKPGLAVITTLACLVAFAALHINIAGYSRMLYAQARNGSLPKSVGKLSARSKTPLNALLLVQVLFGATYLFIGISGVEIGELIKWPSTVFVFAYALTMASAVKCFRKGGGVWWAALISLLLCLVVLWFSRWRVVLPLTSFLLGLQFGRRSAAQSSHAG